MATNKKTLISSFTIIVAFVAVSLIGLATIPSQTVKLSPTRSLPSLSVRFGMTGNSARIVEMEVTSKLEAMLARIGGVQKIRSTSSNNSGSITLELDKHASMDMVRFEASTIIRQTWPSLPGAVSYPVIYVNVPDANATRPFISYNIDATVPPIVIQRYAEEHIKPVLAQIPDIYQVDVYGATPMAWMLEYDINQLDALGLSVYDITGAISAYNRKASLGMALVENESADKRYIRMSLTSGRGEKTIGFHAEDIFLYDREGNLICLNQLLTVVRQEEQPTSYFRINGLNSIYITLTATENANQIRLSQAVQEKIALLKQSLPNGYEMHINYNATEYIHNELNKIYFRTFLTILILLVFVFLTTFNARYLLLIVLSLFFNIAIAFILYYFLKLEIQLYSLAGITISLSLIIDNTIIMSDHYMRLRNRKVILSILAATFTTVGALAMIFFLNERMRLNLQDFAAVVMVNLVVSLTVALFLVPALIDKMNIRRKQFRIPAWLRSRRRLTLWKRPLHRVLFSPKRAVLFFNRFYFRLIRVLLRFRAIAYVVLILAFGLPVFMIPDKIEKQGKFATRYNAIFSSQKFKEKVRPVLEKSLGGTLRLFVQKVYSGSYYGASNDEMSVSISASMPNGTTLPQMNRLIQKMESYLSQFPEIRQFRTRINSPLQANIQVLFTKAAERTGFPYQLKNNVTTEAIKLGGGSWNISGLQERGFSNDVRENAGQMRIKMFGYNYDDLYMHADTLRLRLMENRRIKDVIINSQFSYYKDDYREYTFSLDRERMATENIRPNELYNSISPVFGRNINVGYVAGAEQMERISMSSRQGRLYDLWSLANMGRVMNGKYYKTGELAKIEVVQTPQNIVKEDQQYVLFLQYEYVGSWQQSNTFQTNELKRINIDLPIGYKAQSDSSGYSWRKEDNKQYLLLFVIILIIFFMTAILFNSLKQPFAIIFVIPVSYIGVFLTFYFFKLNFDHGGFASFVLLCGITVNASIYLISEYNRIIRQKPGINRVKAYIKSWNIKIVPIFLTIISTILGFIPFMVGLDREGFWFPLAAGTIGGLIMSLIGIFIFLPIFVLKRKGKNK